jgi:NAD(P)-dependent dehydrogenase (short-subunit alcohol dehydrogenase family)
MGSTASRHTISTPSRSVVVSGAASGIGLATARRLADRGDAVCLVDMAPMDDIVARLTDTGASVRAVRGDVADPATMAEAFAAAASLARVEAAVLNAGVLTGESDITRVAPERYERVIAANIHGVVRGLAAFLEAVGEHPASAVVTSSSVGLVPAPHDPIYAMTKHAVIGLVRSLAANPRYAHLRMNCICPNGVDTPMLGEQLKAGRQLLTADDVACSIVELLASPTSGDAWVRTPTKFERFEFPPNPGYSFPAFEPGTSSVPAK